MHCGSEQHNRYAISFFVKTKMVTIVLLFLYLHSIILPPQLLMISQNYIIMIACMKIIIFAIIIMVFLVL